MSLYDKLMSCSQLGVVERERMLKVLTEVRNAGKLLAAEASGGTPDNAGQDKNWQRILIRVEGALDIALKSYFGREDIENMLLACIFADSLRLPRSEDKPGNFLIHNVDGADAAATVLPRYFDTSAASDLKRMETITQVILEHHIGPPMFVASIVRFQLEEAVGPEIDDGQKGLINSISDKIAHPMSCPRLTDDSGASRIDFNPQECELLARIGVDAWYVPNPESSWYKLSQAVIDSDMLISYASPGGWARMVSVRGPGMAPWFEDDTIFDSFAAARAAYDDAWAVLSSAARLQAKSGLKQILNAINRVKAEMKDWFNQVDGDGSSSPIPRNADGTIPFWNVALRYPSDGELGALEQSQFEFAKKVREQVVTRLKAKQDEPSISQEFARTLAKES